jgi:hypothetical protein
MQTSKFGFPLVVAGSIVSMAGVFANNILLDHILAMIIWVPSNAILMAYFIGRARGLWNGDLGDWIMVVFYAIMLFSGIWGLMQ